ncbi:hypothetical protein [Halomonas sp. A11-A]|uniref:CHASE3 domain-containing protein n=1 Tax=Halomonas sp. A11-A TaxID=2183985 RepID=UPI000D71A426|nr:hypothetical protein [Halomonas sp. A11-A]PWV78254.1 hypothetical protein DER72_106130 [Halomonas sp. A11-A]
MRHLSIRASLLMAFGAMLALILGISVLSFQAQGVSKIRVNPRPLGRGGKRWPRKRPYSGVFCP